MNWSTDDSQHRKHDTLLERVLQMCAIKLIA